MFEVPHWRLSLAAIVHACFGSAAFYHTIALNQIEVFIKNFTSNSIEDHYGVQIGESTLAWLWAALTASTGIGALTLGFAAKYPLETLGTRTTVMVVKNLFEITSSILQYIAVSFNSIEMLFFGKFLSGFAVVLAMHIPVLLTECAPVKFRGMVSVVGTLGWPLFTNIASILGLRQVLGTEKSWPLVLLAPAFFSFVHLMLTPLFPSTPKHLHITKQQHVKAERSLLRYQGSKTDTKNVFEEYEREAEVTNGSGKVVGYKQILTTRHLAWPFWLCMLTCISASLCCHDIAQQYSTGLIEQMDIADETAPIYTLLITQVPSMTTQILCVLLIERVGRRKLLLFGLFLGILANCSLFVAQLMENSNLSTNLGLLGLLLSTVGPDIGPHPIGEVLPGELAPQASRPATSSIAFGSMGWLVPVLTTLFFPPFHYYIGAFAILPLFVSAVAVFVLLFLFLPETQGRSVDEIVKTWMREAPLEQNMLIGKGGQMA